MEQPLWQPSPARIAGTNLARFMAMVATEWGFKTSDYRELHRWSIENPDKFWRSIWSFCGVVAETQGTRTLVDRDKMPGAQFFPDARLNFAENLLRRRDGADAIVFWGEDKVKRRLSHGELYDLVSRLTQALRAEGVRVGDRVAGYMPNMPETIAAMLAATSLGAVWSSCSPDFGVRGVLDRFGQIEPKVLVAAEGYYYNGKAFDSLDKVRDILKELPTVRLTVIVPYTRERPALDGIGGARMLAD
ncbi:MAG: AMP-binding protein, partial [Alphaproteobacteria bacterium]|nr:AMP-binding protein [Alphaproteobacteria bacterium]